ncbi:trypsin-like peptidase domain-containing protein [Paenibacillus alkaliterrae]|uniref:stalk domain-containing protein n=1 Tax=Paenibacillus alkaliterrae TaxID=320909 RepID=UPI001EEB9DAE|nr:stalk domain-containing protein [Paenibacillus alkaliterrae]MCF2938595.1 trypsin-like peptidase domain-containing protein [Paenibacillus alkaliterrae]
MKTKLIQSLLCPLLAAALLLTPLPGTGEATASTANAATKAVAASASQVQVVVDHKKLTLSAPAYVEKGVTFVPMREIFTALGATVTWEGKTGTIIARKGHLTISLQAGKKEAVINGKGVKLNAPSVVRNAVTFVPVRFISEALGASVAWDRAANTVSILSEEAVELAKYKEWLEEQKNIPKLTSTEIVEKFDKSVVLVMTNRAQGSGVVIGDHLILTNYHVISDAVSATALTLYGEELAIEGVVHYDEQADLAIIKTKEPLDVAAVEINYGLNDRKGDKVVAIGSPLGLQNTISDGLISNITYEGGVRYVQTSAPIDHGSSGGALFNEYGELIGITTLGYSDTIADLNFAVSVMHAAILVDDLTEEMIDEAAFLPSTLPDTLVGAPLTDIQKLLAEQFASVVTTEGEANFTGWEAKRDSAGWLVLSADIDPLFYMYYGPSTADELRIWAINLGYELHDLLPDEKIQVLISFERDYGFEPRGFASGEVTSLGSDKWRVRYPVIDMQLKDQLHIQVRD